VIQFFFCLLAHRGGPMAPEERLHAAAERTLALDKTDPFAQISLAMDRFVHFDGPGAVAAAERTIERAPSLVWARAIRGMALLACGRPEESATALEEAIRLAPQDPLLPGMHVTLAIAMIQTGRVDEAGHQLRRAIDDGPELPFAYPMLAVWHTLRSEPDEARALVARAKEIDPDYDPARSARFFAPDDDSAAGIAGILARLTRED